MRPITVAILSTLLVFGQVALAQTAPPTANIVADGQVTPLIQIIPQTRTAHARMGSAIDQYAMFPGLSAAARTAGGASFLIAVTQGIQPQSLVTLAELSVQRRHNMREVYIGGGSGGYAIHTQQIRPMRFELAPDQTDAPPGMNVYLATPESELSRGEYVIVLVTPDAPMPYGGIPARYFDFGVD